MPQESKDQKNYPAPIRPKIEGVSFYGSESFFTVSEIAERRRNDVLRRICHCGDCLHMRRFSIAEVRRMKREKRNTSIH